MKTHPAPKPTRTIRLILTNDIYARLAFLAGRSGVAVADYAQTAILFAIASGGMIPIDVAAEMLTLELTAQRDLSVDPCAETES